MTQKKMHSKYAKNRSPLSLENIGAPLRFLGKIDEKVGIEAFSPPPVRKSREYGPNSRDVPVTKVSSVKNPDNQVSYQEKIKKMQADLDKEREEEERRMLDQARKRRGQAGISTRMDRMSAGGRTKKSKARGCGAARQQMFSKNG